MKFPGAKFLKKRWETSEGSCLRELIIDALASSHSTLLQEEDAIENWTLLWRHRNIGTILDVDLRGLRIPKMKVTGKLMLLCDCSFSEFEDVEFYDCSFQQSNFTRVEFISARFFSSQFLISNISGAKFFDSKFIKTNFSSCEVLDVKFFDSEFENVNARNTFFESKIFNQKQISGIKVENIASSPIKLTW